MIRIAAVGDLHFGPDTSGSLRDALDDARGQISAVLLAGDLTKVGAPAEARALAQEIDGVGVPVVAVLGNHDHHSDRQEEVTAILSASGARVLEASAVRVRTSDGAFGVAGVKGFGGGFPGASGAPFGEEEMKVFARATERSAAGLLRGLRALPSGEPKVALLHYSPIRATLRGEPLEIYPFLGSYQLAEAIDTGGADLALHGHAHRGSPFGMTPGGVEVRNVALPVLRAPFSIIDLPSHTPTRAATAS